MTELGGDFFMSKPKLIIVEAAPAGGKSSTTDLLRERMLNTTLFRLSSIGKDDKYNVFSYHTSILMLLYDMKHSQMNCVMDRSFLSQYVYARLGYKSHSFEEETQRLLDRLNTLGLFYDVHLVLLAANKQDYEERLKRDKAQYIEHSVENSIKQQREYMKVFDEINVPNVHKHVINNSGFTAEQTVDTILSYL